MTQDAYTALLTLTLEAEAQVLGMLLSDAATGGFSHADLVTVLADHLSALDFGSEVAQETARLILSCAERGILPTHEVVIMEMKKSDPNYDPYGNFGAHVLISRAGDPSSRQMLAYCQHIRDVSDRRRAIKALGDAAAGVYDLATPMPATLDALSRQVGDLGARGQLAERKRRDVLGEMHAEIAAWNDDPDRDDGYIGMRGTRTGLRCLDRVTRGLRPGTLTLLGARTSAGKTAMALTMADAATAVEGAQVGFISAEMTEKQLMYRLLSMKSGIPYASIESGRVSVSRLAGTFETLHAMPLRVLDASDAASQVNGYHGTVTPEAIERRMQVWQRERPLSAVFVDFLALITPPDGTERDARDEKISAIVTALKMAAIRANCPMVVLTQLNRGTESVTSHLPSLSNIAESDGAGQRANMAILMMRPDYYQRQGLAMPEDFAKYPAGYTVLQIAKHRDGPTGRLHALFLHQQMRFVDFDPDRMTATDYDGTPIILGEERTA